MSKSAIRSVVGFALIAALTLTLLMSLKLNAQEGNGSGLRITPLRHEYALNPGDSEAFSISVRNVSGNSLGVIAEVNDFIPQVDGSPKLVLDGEQSPNSLIPYVSGVENFTLEAEEEKKLTYILSLTEDVNPGALYGAIRYSAVPPEELKEGSTPVSLAASVASLLLVNVQGDVTEAMSLTDLTALKDGNAGSFFETAPNQVGITLSNDGNTIIKPYGTVQVKNWGGDVVYEYELNPDQIAGNVLPQSERQFIDDIENIGSFGRYTIEANVVYGEGGGNIIAVQSNFWVIPWKIILLAIALLVFLIWFFTRGIKLYNKHVLKKSKGETVKKK